ncbi:MAG: pilin [Patescibacteria group bacterium]
MKFFLYQHHRVVRAIGILALLLVLSAYLIPANPVFADSALQNLGKAGAGMGATSDGAGGTPKADFPTIIGGVIKVLLGILGVIFLIIIVFAGVKWMTAHGEPKDIETAKDSIRQAIIGLGITLSAYAITDFVVRRMISATTDLDYTTEIK